MSTNSGIWNLKQVRDGRANAQYGPAPIISTLTGTVVKGVASTIDLNGIFGTVNGIVSGTVRFTSGATTADVSATPNNAGTAITSISVPASIYNLVTGSTVVVRVIFNGLESNVVSFTITAPTLGASYLGGYYGGTIDIGGGTCYYLIVAPNATGCFCCVWKTTNSCTIGSTCTKDGYFNTETYLANSDHPAGNFCATRSIGGYSDWYLPAADELVAVYANKSSLPSGEGWHAGRSWSSTDCYCAGGCYVTIVDMSSGSPGQDVKNRYGFNYKGRAIRRSAI